MSILQELWYGNIRPNENKKITEEERKLIELIAKHQDKIENSLNDDVLEEFKKYIECFEEYFMLMECQAFEIGFKLAIKMLTE